MEETPTSSHGSQSPQHPPKPPPLPSASTSASASASRSKSKFPLFKRPSTTPATAESHPTPPPALAQPQPQPQQLKVSGAGIICFSRHRGKVYYLLGREAYVPGWRFGSSRWSDFAGGSHVDEQHHGGGDDDTSGIDAATREFSEESMCAVPLKYGRGDSLESLELPNDSNGDSNGDGDGDEWDYAKAHETTRRLLQQGRYTARLVERVRRGRSLHVTFIKEIPWIGDLPVRFATLRRIIVDLQHRGRQIKMLEDRIPRRSPFVRAGFSRRRHDGTTSVLQTLDATFNAVTNTLRTRLLTFVVNSGNIVTTIVSYSLSRSDVSHARDYVTLLERRRALRQLYASLPTNVQNHPAIHISHYVPTTPLANDRGDFQSIADTMVDIHINEDYLEKDLLQWWPSHTLRHLVQRRTDRIGAERFRQPFLRTIAIVLDNMRE